MTKRHTKEVRPHPVERSPWTQAPSSKRDQNEQNSKLTDGAYFWLDRYLLVFQGSLKASKRYLLVFRAGF